MKRIFDNPNHPQYGPVRRMWVILVQLDLLDAAERWGNHRIVPWDEWLATMLDNNKHVKESAYQRALILMLGEGWM